MAFYGYNGGDVADCNWSPYSVDSSYEFQEPESMNYYYYSNTNNQFDSAQHYYSVYDQTETSTVIHYEHQTPPSYVYDSFYPQTNFVINYSTLEFNETEFEEYDDTPYGGGYDIALTYGKPLPPSGKICYPRSNPQPGSKSVTPDGLISSPYGEISDTKPQQNENGIKPVDDLGHREDTNSNVKEDHVIVENPIEDGDRVAVDEDLSYDDNDDQVPRYAYGSGLEAIDICDSFFGYWPCLEKRKQRYHPCNAMVYDQYQRDPWKSAADYLFGSGYAYEEEPRRMCHGHGYYFDGQHFDYSYDSGR